MSSSSLFRSLCLVLGPTLAGVASADADCPDRWLVSTTDPLAPMGLMDHDDACLFQVGPNMPAFTSWTLGHWFALAGFQPSDIDAVGLLPVGLGNDHRAAIAFSLLSNEGGFLDGDVLGIGPGGGLVTLVPEAALSALLGVPTANLDVDAVDYDELGRLVFSLQGDLSGTVFGNVDNGDVLRLEPDGSLSRPYTEADVQAALDQTGMTSGPIGDVHGVTSYLGDLFVALQGPSDVDGGVLRLGAAPLIVAGDLVLGLGGAELDALTALESGWDLGTIALDTDVSVPGAFVHGEGFGFTPGAPLLLFVAGQPGFEPGYGFGGFGDLFLDPLDPFLLQATAAVGFPVVLADGVGHFSLDFQLPAGVWGGAWMGGQGWSYQALDLMNFALTAPFRVQLF